MSGPCQRGKCCVYQQLTLETSTTPIPPITVENWIKFHNGIWRDLKPGA